MVRSTTERMPPDTGCHKEIPSLSDRCTYRHGVEALEFLPGQVRQMVHAGSPGICGAGIDLLNLLCNSNPCKSLISLFTLPFSRCHAGIRCLCDFIPISSPDRESERQFLRTFKLLQKISSLSKCS